MAALKPGDFEVVTSQAGGFQEAVDVTTTAPVPDGGQTLAQITAALQAGLTALGGDHPPAGGGPGPATNTYSYLKAHVAGGAAANLPDPDPPYRLYPANLNQIGPLGNPFQDVSLRQMEETVGRQRTWLFLLAGAVGPVLFWLGDHGWVQSANFIVVGLLVIAFAAGLRQLFPAGRASRFGPRSSLSLGSDSLRAESSAQTRATTRLSPIR